jgi:bacterioferritin-associated ferredoxin
MAAPVSPGMIRTDRCPAAVGRAARRRGNALMFVCLCTGATRHVVADVVAGGACTSKQVAEACGAGADCGRCRRTVRAIIAAAAQVNAGAAC